MTWGVVRKRGYPSPVGGRVRGLFLVMFLAVLALSGCTPRGGEDASASVPWEGGSAPDFRLPRLTGGEMTLSELRGKVVLINFWATWCVPCRAEMPSMEMLYRDFQPKGLEILAVSIDLPGEPGIQTFVREFELTFPILLDFDFVVDEAYQVRVVPTSVLVDREGKVSHRVMGAMDWNDAPSRRMIRQLIHGDSPLEG